VLNDFPAKSASTLILEYNRQKIIIFRGVFFEVETEKPDLCQIKSQAVNLK
jgi:hypothetical protein